MNTYIVPLIILDAPPWWRNYIENYLKPLKSGDRRFSSVKEAMFECYNADVRWHNGNSSKIIFNDDSLHTLFMMQWT